MNRIFLNRPIVALLVLATFNVALVFIRFITSHEIAHLHLWWNLFLAWVPVLISILWVSGALDSKFVRWYDWRHITCFGFWLLFFPNAPYLITDIKHFTATYRPSMWLDLLMLFCTAVNGLILTIYSMHLVLGKLKQLFRSDLAMLITFCSLMLSGYGIYLGRIQRWNSWDLFLQPVTLLKDSFYSFFEKEAIIMTFGFSGLILIIYYLSITVIHYERIKK